MSLSVHFGALRTGELRELLEDEEKLNDIIRCSEKFQGLQRAAEEMLVSNQNLAKVGLSQKPKFKDTKLLLSMKYKEVGNLTSIIQAKQEQLSDTYSAHYAQWSLLKKINHAEEESEMLFQRFAEGRMLLAEFLDGFLKLRKLQHIRQILLNKLQEMIEYRSTERLSEIHQDTFSAEQIHNTCLPVCGLTTAVILPVCCHPRFLQPGGTHIETAHRLQHVRFCHDYKEPLRPRLQGRSPKCPARPVRLEPLKVQQKRHQQAPQ